MEKCAQSLSVFPVFALEIWTLRYEPLVSGSSCSLFGCTFLAQCLVRLRIHICVFFGAVLGLVVDMSVAVQRQGFGPTVRKLWVPQLHSSSLWSLSLVCRSCRFSVQVWRRQSYPTVAACRTCSRTRLLTCLRCATPGAWSSVLKLRILRTCSSSTRCGRPCDFAVTCLAVGGATHSVHRLIWWTSQFEQRQWYVVAMRDPGLGFFGAPVSVTGAGGAGVAGSFTPR